jgi:hypothetical protein
VSARGEQNSKLKESEVLAIHRLAWNGRYLLREIGAAFSISLSQVWMIKHKREWRWLLLDNNNEERMTDRTKDEEFEARLAASEKRVAELERQLRGEPAEPIKSEPYQPRDWTAGATMDAETMREWAKAIPPDLARQLREDALKPNPVTGASQAQLTPHRNERVQIERGSGWAPERKIEPPPGLNHIDAQVDAQDARDRRDAERRLIWGKKE